MENKPLIYANEVKKMLVSVKEWFGGHPGIEHDKLARAVVEMCIEEVKKIKPVDAVEVVHGRWIKGQYLGECTCEHCGFEYCEADPEYEPFKYCPECGSKNE